MRKLILLTGDLACGKTTFSKILSKRYSIETYNKDTIKEILGDTIGFTNREENLKLSHATIAIMTQIFKTNAPYGHDLILEANFHDKEIDDLRVLAKDFNFEILIINFVADENVLFDRFNYRIQNEHRHPVHQSAGLTSFEAFCEYIEKSRREVSLKECMTVDATTFDYQTNEALLEKIDTFVKG